MVILSIVDPNRAPILEDGTVLRHAVRNASKEFRQVEHGVGVMTNPDEEYLPVQFVHTTDGTCGDVGRNRKWAGGDLRRLRASRCKSKRMAASDYPG